MVENIMMRRRKYTVSFIAIHCLLGMIFDTVAQNDPLPPLSPITVENFQNLTELHTIGRGWITDTDLSPNGTTLAVAGSLGVWLHDANNLSEAPRLLVDSPMINYVKFSPDGKRLAYGNPDIGIHIWDAQSLIEQMSFQDKPNMIAFSPDGKSLAYEKQQGEIVIRDIDADTEIELLQFSASTYDDAIQGLAFSPDGKLLSAATMGWIRIWTLGSQKVPQMIATDGFWYGNILAFSPDSKLIAAGQGERAGVWDVATQSKITTFSAHNYAISSVSFSPDGKRLITAVGYFFGARVHDSVQIWDVGSGDQVAVIGSSTSGLVKAAISPDGQSLFISSLDTVQRWRVDTNTSIDSTTGYLGYVRSLTFSADKSLIAAGFENGEVRIIDTSTGGEKALLETWASVDKVVFSSDGSVLTSLSTLHGLPSPSKVWVWNVQPRTEQLRLEDGLEHGASDIALSSDGKLLALSFCSELNYGDGDWQCHIQLWDTSTQMLFTVFDLQSDYVSNLVFSLDGKYLASKNTKSIRFWDVTAREELTIFRNSPELFTPSSYASFFGPQPGDSEEHQIISNEVIILWQKLFDDTGNSPRDIQENYRDTTFSADHTLLASDGRNGTIRLWGIPATP